MARDSGKSAITADDRKGLEPPTCKHTARWEVVQVQSISTLLLRAMAHQEQGEEWGEVGRPFLTSF